MKGFGVFFAEVKNVQEGAMIRTFYCITSLSNIVNSEISKILSFYCVGHNLAYNV